MKIKYFFFYSITVPNTSEKPEKVLDRWILRYLDGGKDIQEEISSFKEEEDRLCDKEDLNLERFKARSDWAAKKIFLSYWSKYSCFDLTLYRVTFFGNMIYIANN